jgi:hypothetical protein
MAPEFGGHLGIGIRAFADRIQAALAEKTRSASDGKRDDDAVADLHAAHVGAGRDDLAHEFMSEDIALFQRRNDAVVQVQVGAADRGQRDAYDLASRGSTIVGSVRSSTRSSSLPCQQLALMRTAFRSGESMDRAT